MCVSVCLVCVVPNVCNVSAVCSVSFVGAVSVVGIRRSVLMLYFTFSNSFNISVLS